MFQLREGASVVLGYTASQTRGPRTVEGTHFLVDTKSQHVKKLIIGPRI